MPLDIETLLDIEVEIKDTDPILERITRDQMAIYLEANNFEYVTREESLDGYEHRTLMVSDDSSEYRFGTWIPRTEKDNDRGCRIQFIMDMQRFYRLKDKKEVSQLRILNDLL
ncbi:hypothetical protein J4216_00030 [Candidatus Woesearchaeota archaeon]|nr:hypothetical protein [Candidatus Woesearchaeota archaeon]